MVMKICQIKNKNAIFLVIFNFAKGLIFGLQDENNLKWLPSQLDYRNEATCRLQ